MWNLAVKANILNEGSESKTFTVKTTLNDIPEFISIPGIPSTATPFDESTMYGDEIYKEKTSSVTVEAGGTAEFDDTLIVENPRLRDGRNDPFRYAAVLEIYDGDTLVDSVTEYIGFRYFHVDKNEGFFLNGKKYPLRGVGYHEDAIGKGSGVTDDDWDESFALVYEIGATGVRLVHYPHDPYSYELCDSYGIISWTEISQISAIEVSETYFSRAKTSLRELIRQHINSPSVCFWGIQNEVGVGRNEPWPDSVDIFMNELNDIAHEEDPTRLTTQASCNWNICGKEWKTDLFAINTYPLWYIDGDLGTTADDYIKDNLENTEIRYWNDIPLGISEYGGTASIYQHSEFTKQPAVPRLFTFFRENGRNIQRKKIK